MPLPHFAIGQPLTADDANLLARQGVITVPTLTERDAIAPEAGMVVFVEADNGYYGWVGGAWRVLWQDTGWVPLVSASGDSIGLAVCRVGSVVALRGEVWGVTAGETLFTLAAQFRPTNRMAYFAVRAGGGTSAVSGDARVYIQTSGEVRLHNITSMPTSSPGLDISKTWLV